MDDDSVPAPQMSQPASRPDLLDAVLHDAEGGDERVDDQTEDLLDVAALARDLKVAYSPTRPLVPSPELREFTGPHRLTDDHRSPAGLPALVDEPPPTRAQQPEHALAREQGRGGAWGWATTGSRRPLIMRRLVGFIGTLTGKLVLGATVAAASMGALNAGGVVDMPVLPPFSPSDEADSAETSASSSATDGTGAVRASDATATTGTNTTGTNAGIDNGGGVDDADNDSGDGPGGTGLPSEAAGGLATADGATAAAEAYTSAVHEWTDCVAETAAAGDNQAGNRGIAAGADLTLECGPRPEPADFGLTEIPDQADDTPQDPASTAPGSTAQSTPEAPDAPGNPAVTTPTGPADPTNQATAPTTASPATPASPVVPGPADPRQPE